MTSTNPYVGVMSQELFAMKTESQLNPCLSVTSPPEKNIVLNNGMQEVLRIAEDGFYVRGKKVEADEKEAAAVYRAFKQWLVESELRR